MKKILKLIKKEVENIIEDQRKMWKLERDLDIVWVGITVAVNFVLWSYLIFEFLSK